MVTALQAAQAKGLPPNAARRWLLQGWGSKFVSAARRSAQEWGGDEQDFAMSLWERARRQRELGQLREAYARASPGSRRYEELRDAEKELRMWQKAVSPTRHPQSDTGPRSAVERAQKLLLLVFSSQIWDLLWLLLLGVVVLLTPRWLDELHRPLPLPPNSSAVAADLSA